MSPSTADVYPETPAAQDILGGTCPLAPIQVCILWAARQEKVISPLAFKVYVAAHEIKYWRCKIQPGETYHCEPYAFEPADVSRLLPGVPVAKLARAFSELKAIQVLNISDTGIGFAQSLDDVTANERVKQRARAMFDQLHLDTRDKLVKIPRRLLRLIVQCGRRIVRAATLIGMLLTTMLTKRKDRYGGYKGCCKAQWIANVFGVDASRVKSERAKLIEEGWFTREPTTPRARKKFGQWVRLNLIPPKPIASPGAPPAGNPPKVQPQNAAADPKVQPLLNPSLSSSEESLNNQALTARDPDSGAYQPPASQQPSWTDIKLEDLQSDTRSEQLRHEAIHRGYVKDTPSDRVDFFAAIAHALRVSKTNACGLLRTVVEKGLWHVISQADEYNGITRLKHAAHTQATQETQHVHAHPFLTTSTRGDFRDSDQPIELSQDALIVQTVTADLHQAGVTGDVLQTVKQHGYLRDWERDRWERAEQELAQARLLQARQRYQEMEMTAVGDILEADSRERDAHSKPVKIAPFGQSRYQGPDSCALDRYRPRLMTTPSS
jgi:hypothetical protein